MKRLLFCLTLCYTLSAMAAPAGRAAVIDQEITKLVGLYTDGFGHNNAKMRYVTFGSLFNTARQDAVAFFSLAEVDNSNVHFLEWKTAKISKGQIVVQGTRWAEGDAGCCPTKPIEVTFNIATGLAAGLSPEQYPVLREREAPGQAKQE